MRRIHQNQSRQGHRYPLCDTNQSETNAADNPEKIPQFTGTTVLTVGSKGETSGVPLKIYQDNKEWPGNLQLIIKNLNYNVDNRALPEDIGEKRMTCGQRCWRQGTCHFCVTAFMFAEQLRKEAQSRRQEVTIDNN